MGAPKKRLPERWRSGARSARSVQVAFDTSEQVSHAVRLAAAVHGLTPSDMVRKIIGLAFQGRPVRPRLTLTLNEEDYHTLAGRYGLKAEEKQEIKRCVMEDLMRFSRKESAR